jgi:methanogenesis marker radical SAM protein
MRFANKTEQGLILGNAPLIPGVIPHTAEEFKQIVTDISKRYNFRVTGTPLWDPKTGAPFALASHKEEIRKLPAVTKSATIITSSIAQPLLSLIFDELGGTVNVLPVAKDVGCLMTIKDLVDIDLSKVKETVLVPGRMLAHDKDIHRSLTKDGKDRLVRRGPDRLTVDGEMSISMSEQEVLDLELEAFKELIEEINALGV